MDKYSFFIEEEEYFEYFEKIYNDQAFVYKFPLVSNRMKMLCHTMKKKIHERQKDDFFHLHAEVLGLDAQLQILLMLVDLAQNDSALSEEMILKYSQEDYLVFIKDFCGSDVDEIASHSLYFSVI